MFSSEGLKAGKQRDGTRSACGSGLSSSSQLRTGTGKTSRATSSTVGLHSSIDGENKDISVCSQHPNVGEKRTPLLQSDMEKKMLLVFNNLLYLEKKKKEEETAHTQEVTPVLWLINKLFQ